MQERPREAEPARVVPRPSVHAVAQDRDDRSTTGARGSGACGRSGAPPPAGWRSRAAHGPRTASRPAVPRSRPTTTRAACRPSAASTANASCSTRPADERQVPPVHVVAAEHGDQRLVGLVRLGDDHESRRSGVEPVHDPRPQRTAGGRERHAHARAAGSPACRSVAARVGCVIKPGGLAITSRCSSSNRTGTGGPLGLQRRLGVDRRSPTPRRPERERLRADDRRRRSRGPDAIARCTSARASPASRARTASSRPGSPTNRSAGIVGRLGASRSRGERGDGQQHGADHDRANRPG